MLNQAAGDYFFNQRNPGNRDEIECPLHTWRGGGSVLSSDGWDGNGCKAIIICCHHIMIYSYTTQVYYSYELYGIPYDVCINTVRRPNVQYQILQRPTSGINKEDNVCT